MQQDEFLKYKKELTDKVDTLYKTGQLFDVIALLEESELDFDLTMLLVRTYINVANQSGDPTTLFNKALTLLDKFNLEGKTSAKFLFYRGYILFKQGLVSDALTRFEEALKHADITDSSLFKNVTTMIDNSKALLAQASFDGIDEQSEKEILGYLQNNFGAPHLLCTFDKVKLYQIAPSEKYPYNMLFSVGLSGKDNQEAIEVALTLPNDYRFVVGDSSCFEVYMLIEIVKALIAETNPIGFGYYLEKESGFSKFTAFTGAMLASFGEVEKEKQSITLRNGKIVNFYEVIPLRPMELHYRKSHSAHELLELYKQKLIKLTPFINTRDDVCAML